VPVSALASTPFDFPASASASASASISISVALGSSSVLPIPHPAPLSPLPDWFVVDRSRLVFALLLADMS
jgi:hypothetical protein